MGCVVPPAGNSSEVYFMCDTHLFFIEGTLSCSRNDSCVCTPSYRGTDCSCPFGLECHPDNTQSCSRGECNCNSKSRGRLCDEFTPEATIALAVLGGICACLVVWKLFVFAEKQARKRHVTAHSSSPVEQNAPLADETEARDQDTHFQTLSPLHPSQPPRVCVEVEALRLQSISSVTHAHRFE
jgi:hypothetical protein